MSECVDQTSSACMSECVSQAISGCVNSCALSANVFLAGITLPEMKKLNMIDVLKVVGKRYQSNPVRIIGQTKKL